MADRLDVLRKHCSRCNESLPWSAYHAAVKDPDGSMLRPQAHCKECVKARRREMRRDDPGWARARDRRDYLRMRARMETDEEYAASKRANQRERSMVFRVRRREEGEAA